jgi:hypothetical protein
MTADWYKRFYMRNQNNGFYALCVEQIHNYMDRTTKKPLSWMT